jgi:hypothetical protein
MDMAICIFDLAFFIDGKHMLSSGCFFGIVLTFIITRYEKSGIKKVTDL